MEVLDITNLKPAAPFDWDDISDVSSGVDNQYCELKRTDKWIPDQIVGTYDLKPTYPKYIRKKYHSPKRRSQELFKFATAYLWKRHKKRELAIKGGVLDNPFHFKPYEPAFKKNDETGEICCVIPVIKAD